MTKGQEKANVGHLVKDDPAVNPNALHEFHSKKRGPRGIPKVVMAANNTTPSEPKDPGHPFAQTKHISFNFFDQRKSNAPFGYEHFVSLPPDYVSDTDTHWPLILFLHGAGESQRPVNESYLSIRHGIPKIVLCYDKMKQQSSSEDPSISIPRAERLNQNRQADKSGEPVPAEVCTLVAENFITVTPSLNLNNGYGWNASILEALLDEIVERYRVDLDRIHVTGFSMGGYGTWDLAYHTPKRFASLMPICGGGDTLRVSQIRHIPHWVHHGELDDIIPIPASDAMVKALKQVGAPDVQFTRYPRVMHDSWTRTYNNPDVYRWMLEKKRVTHGDEKAVPEWNKVIVS
ncbi:alpha/beta-hydrolase [Xylariomycetidae sp. FL2044]|nr:alpha/beta-hydrolase [Xylariomycetidae sp. FL2044]